MYLCLGILIILLLYLIVLIFYNSINNLLYPLYGFLRIVIILKKTLNILLQHCQSTLMIRSLGHIFAHNQLQKHKWFKSLISSFLNMHFKNFHGSWSQPRAHFLMQQAFLSKHESIRIPIIKLLPNRKQIFELIL